jgi:hypothetical protein
LVRFGAYNEAQHEQWFKDQALTMVQSTHPNNGGPSFGSVDRVANGLAKWSAVRRAAALGFNVGPGQDTLLGRKIAEAFRQKYRAEPAREFTGVVRNGSNMSCNAYTLKECEECIDGAIRAFFGQ